MDASTYANILFSASFIIYAVGVAMVELYERSNESNSRKRTGELDIEHGEHGHERSLWSLLPVPASVRSCLARTRGPAGGGIVMGSPEAEMREQYESLPLSSRRSGNSGSPVGQHHPGNRSVFDLGEEEEDDGGDRYWEEGSRREQGGTRPLQASANDRE